MKAIAILTMIFFIYLNGFSQCSYFIKIASGNNGAHSLAIKNDGTLWAWGKNDFGQLGDGTNINKNIPIQIGNDTNWKEIAVGAYHSLAITSDGKLWAWGNNLKSQLGNGTNISVSNPIQIGSANNWKTISAGALHSIGKTSDGKIWAWGNNSYGQLGDGTTTNRDLPTQITTSTDWVTVTAGEFHTMALSSNGLLWAWGNNSSGQLGDGSYIQNQTPKVVLGPNNWVSMSAGGSHSAGITADGKIWTWGDNNFGQLGDGTLISRNAPVQVGSQNNWIKISAGQNHTACISKDRNLYAWGNNNFGQLGDGTNIQRFVPTQILNTQLWVNINIGGDYSMASTADGKVWSWGCNQFGQLGDGTNLHRITPNAISSGPLTYFAFQPLSVNACEGSKIILKSTANGMGIISYQWKKNGVNLISTVDSLVFNSVKKSDTGYYQLEATGLCNTTVSDTAYLEVAEKVSVISQPNSKTINSGSNTSFTVIAQGDIIGYQWFKNGSPISKSDGSTLILKNVGSNDSGSYSVKIYGSCDTIASANATLNVLSSLCSYFVSITSGSNSEHSLGIKNDGTLWAWGINNFGQLGDTSVSVSNFPIQIGYLNNWVSVAAGESHSLGITSDGKLWAWGKNDFGQLGYGTTTSVGYPKQIGKNLSWITIAAGTNHSLGITSDRKLMSWGHNGYGQIGDGTTNQVLTPKQIGTRTNWIKISGGEKHSAALTSDGKIWVWGKNDCGQIGDGTYIQRKTPVQVGNSSNWTSISAGTNHTLGQTNDGKIWAWGKNDFGQLGDGTTITRKIPQQVGSNSNWLNVSGSCKNSIALNSDGELWIWGDNTFGQLGDSTNTQQLNPTKVNANIEWNFYAIGKNHTIAKSDEGSLYSWGRNLEGQLGDSTFINKNTPNLVYASKSLNIAIQPKNTKACEGNNSMLFVKANSNGNINYQWYKNGIKIGNNQDTLFFSNIGLSDSGFYKVVVTSNCNTITSDSIFLSVNQSPIIINQSSSQKANEGGNVTLSVNVKGSGMSYQWRHNGINILGANDKNFDLYSVTKADSGFYSVFVNSECGEDSSDDINISIVDALCSTYSKIFSSPNSNHNLVEKNDGSLWAWGDNTYGQLGNGTKISSNKGVQIGTQKNWAAISTGESFTVALTNEGKLYSWGKNSYGQLGDGTFIDKVTPVQIGLNKTWSSISAGLDHVIAIASDGTLWSWGRDIFGQLGVIAGSNQNTPIQIGNSNDWIKISCGNNHALAITKDGKLWAWGKNDNGQLGDGTFTSKSIPTQIAAATTWKNIIGGGSHSAAIDVNGKLFAWGKNDNGQLGDGTLIQKLIPTQIGSGTFWKKLSAGYSHTLALTHDGKIYAWGDNSKGQLGNGTNVKSLIPIQISPDTMFVQISTGGNTSMAISVNGKAWAWGENNKGQIGDNSYIQRNNPVVISNAPFISFNQQPESKFVCLGQDIVFKGNAISNSNVSYTWYKNDSIIENAHSDSLLISKVNPNDSGIYYVVASGVCKSLKSSNGTFAFKQNTAITNQPQSIYSCSGGDKSFSLTAKGGDSISYQWFKNNVYTGNKESTLYIKDAGLSDTGVYFAKVTSECGTVYSDTVVLNIGSTLKFIKQPVSTTMCSNGHIVLSVALEGNGPKSYQWYKNNEVYGNNQETLILYDLMPSDTGYYKVKVTGICGSVFSDSAKVSLKNKMNIVKQPKSQAACIGSKLQISVETSEPNFTNYQWYKNGLKFGNNSNTLSIESMSDTDAASYRVLTIGSCNTMFSDSFKIAMNKKLSIISEPTNTKSCVGQDIDLEVKVSDSAYVSYKWMKNNLALGVNTNKLSLKQIDENNAGIYNVEIKSACGSIMSNAVKLTINKCSSNIDNQSDNISFSAFPNPFHNQFKIAYEAKVNQLVGAFIYDMEGRLVYHTELPSISGKNEQTIFPYNLLNGAYMLFVEVDGQKLPFKLLRE